MPTDTTDSRPSAVPTIAGELDVDRLGTVLMHEHIFILSTELQQNYPDILMWNEEEKVADAIRRLRAAKEIGVDTIVDMTVIGMGRDVSRVQRIADAADINIIVATGLYTFNELPKFLEYVGPGGALGGDEPMVEMFVKDIAEGIADTGIKAGMLKCATDVQGVTPGVERVLRAVAQAHRETGVPITTHTHAHTERGTEQLDIFDSEGVDLTRVIVGHSGDTEDADYLRSLADQGAVLGMDRFGVQGGKHIGFDARVGIVARMCELGYASQMVLSHDVSCWMDWAPRERFPGTAYDIPTWHLRHIHESVLPALKERGVTDAQINEMLIENPRRIFSAPRTAY